MPFAYTSSFTVTSFFNGIKYVFLATKKDGYPSILPISEESTTEPNGLLIRIPVNKDILNKFYDEENGAISINFTTAFEIGSPHASFTIPKITFLESSGIFISISNCFPFAIIPLKSINSFFSKSIIKSPFKKIRVLYSL